MPLQSITRPVLPSKGHLDNGMWLCDQLMSANILNCCQCSKLLIPPIMLLSKFGNVCSECYQYVKDNETFVGLQNVALEILLEKMFFRCSHNGHGCDEILSYSELKSHQETCSYKMVKCIYNSCQWFDKKKDFVAHIFDAHSAESVRHFPGKSILIPKLSEEIIRLLDNEEGKFIYRIKPIDGNLYLIIYSSQPSVTFTIRYQDGHKQVIFPYHVVTNDLDRFLAFDKNAALSLGVHVNDANCKVRLSFEADSDKKFAKLNLELLKVLKCSLCSKYIRPPIYQCENGHSVCHKCSYKTDFCHKCKSRFCGTRNFSVEKMTSFLRFPCSNKGCSITSLLSENHELSCFYHTWKCPLPWCKFLERYAKVKLHMLERHQRKTTVFGESIFEFNSKKLSSNVRFYYYFILYDRLFEMTYQHDHGESKMSRKFSWEVEILGPVSDVQFDFEIHVYIGDMSKGQRFSFSAPCVYQSSEANSTNCITVDESTLNKVLSSKSGFAFHCSITKNNRS